MYSIGSNGALTAVQQVVTGSGRSCLAIDASGDFMYVPHGQDRAVSNYTINKNTDAVTLLETTPISIAPQVIALTP